MTHRALYVADGPSDLPMARHLERSCRAAGASVEVVQFPPDRLRVSTVEGRLRAILSEDPDFELIFVHRDSEHRDSAPRYREVREAGSAVAFPGPVVAVVPIRMTEAWLLLDETAIRAIAGKPSGRTPLDLPVPNGVERLANPKKVLREALVAASGLTGRRLKVFRRQCDIQRRLLLERLNPDGPVTQLTAWRRLQTDIRKAVDSLESS